MLTEISSIQEFITMKPVNNSDFHTYSYYMKSSTLGSLEIPFRNLITTDYLDDFKKEAYKINLTAEEFRKYKYKPKLLANDVYGNGEFHYIILAINGLYSIKDFNKQSIYLIPKKELLKLLEYVYSSNKQYIDSYNYSHGIK